MAFNVNNFISHFSGHEEFSKSSKFEVQIFAPASFGPFDTSGLSLQCETAELPGYNINTVEGRVYGASYAVAQNPVYNEISLTFICAGDLWEKQFFDAWMDFIMPKQQYGYTPEYYTNYVAPISVISYLETAESPDQPRKAMVVRLIDAFPTSVAPVSLNWSSDEINRISVVFKYARWESVEGITIPVRRTVGSTLSINSFASQFRGGDILSSLPRGGPTAIFGVDLPKIRLPGGIQVPGSINLPRVSLPGGIQTPPIGINLPQVSFPGGAASVPGSINLPKVSIGGVKASIQSGVDQLKSSAKGAAASTVSNILNRRIP
jgi:hypothetical protein